MSITGAVPKPVTESEKHHPLMRWYCITLLRKRIIGQRCKATLLRFSAARNQKLSVTSHLLSRTVMLVASDVTDVFSRSCCRTAEQLIFSVWCLFACLPTWLVVCRQRSLFQVLPPDGSHCLSFKYQVAYKADFKY